MYVCMYVYMCVYVCMCVYVYVCVCVYIYMSMQCQYRTITLVPQRFSTPKDFLYLRFVNSCE